MNTPLTSALCLLLAGAAFATPSGLNNIPTADTVPHRTVAVQYFSSFGGANQFGTSEPGKSGHWLGFKTGWDFEPVHVEWGMDSLLGTGLSGPLFFQDEGPHLAVGGWHVRHRHRRHRFDRHRPCG
jgi:hypothetical protein